MTVPYTFGTATNQIPLSQLDANFASTITLGNTAIQLGNTVTTLNNMTLANVTVSSGNVTVNNAVITTANVATANVTTLIAGTGSSFSNANKTIAFYPNYSGFGGNQVTSIETGVGYLSLTMMASTHVWNLNGSSNVMGQLDTNGNWIFNTNTTAATLSTNGHMTISRVNNTTLKFSLRGTDGVTRSATLTLS